jgi:hypothetical protein
MKNVIIIIAAALCSLTATAQQEATFQSFLQQFPKATLPYTVGADQLQQHLEQRAAKAPMTKAARLAWEYYGFLPTLEENASENRMPVYPEPIAAFETASHYAVVFNTGRNFARQYKTYNIAVFDKQGNHIQTRTIAGVNPTSLAAATINNNLEVTISEYSVNWSKDYITNGIEGNTIIGIAPIGTRTVKATAAVKESCEDWQNKPAAQMASATLTAGTK